MAAPRTVLVVNPESQSGALGRQWPELATRIRRELGSFDERFTRAAGDASRLTAEALRDGANTVVAVGGDGTINEVVNGFFEDGKAIAPEACLGLLPFGTGGDFRKTVHIPKDLDRAARILARRNTREIDVGRLEYTTDRGETESRLFVNIASFGMSGVVDELVNSSSKRLGGRVTFMLATVRASLGYRNQRVRMVFDGDEGSAIHTTIHVVAVANGRYFGGGMFMAPRAELDDGLFDVVALGDVSVAQLVRHGRRLYDGSHLELEHVSHRRARKVRAEPVDGDAVLLDLDGETPGRLPATFELQPAALRLIVPA